MNTVTQSCMINKFIFCIKSISRLQTMLMDKSRMWQMLLVKLTTHDATQSDRYSYSGFPTKTSVVTNWSIVKTYRSLYRHFKPNYPQKCIIRISRFNSKALNIMHSRIFVGRWRQTAYIGDFLVEKYNWHINIILT